MLSTLLKDNVIDDGLMWMSRVIKKNFKPIRHPNATNVDDHEEGGWVLLWFSTMKFSSIICNMHGLLFRGKKFRRFPYLFWHAL
ncbi:hypothetical protein JHK87_050991 [Glycine soja]|uniref:Uncharacterized protein n=1 Tax=Glycine max TaxID=3847 RepID=A0A0R0F347_SOYBN|nr:hypothetical protein JHK87_050991 [Glycine soja]